MAKKGEEHRELSVKEERFCIEYSVNDNATQSYLRAFPNVTYNTARNEGAKLLAEPCIRQRIDFLREERNERLKIDKDDILRKFKLLSEYDAADFHDEDGRLKPLSELHPDLRYVVAGIEISEKITGEEGDGISRLVKIKLPSKQDALTALGKHLMLFNDVGSKDNPLTGNIEHKHEISDEALAAIAAGKNG